MLPFINESYVVTNFISFAFMEQKRNWLFLSKSSWLLSFLRYMLKNLKCNISSLFASNYYKHTKYYYNLLLLSTPRKRNETRENSNSWISVQSSSRSQRESTSWISKVLHTPLFFSHAFHIAKFKAKLNIGSSNINTFDLRFNK
jgi:hypothetical protein